MGYSGKIEEKIKAQTLRKQGYSYKEILQKVTVSKDTLSRWCKDISLSEEQKLRLLQNKALGQKKGSLIASENKRRRRIEQTERMKTLAINEIGDVNDRDNFIADIALYAAEGVKMDGKVAFSNVDSALIKFMIMWFERYSKVSKEKFRGRIWLHSNQNETSAKEFWSQLTNIPISQFYKTYSVQTRGSKKLRKNIHKYGVFSIVINDSTLHRRIMGWIYALFNDKILRYSKTVSSLAPL